MQDEVLRLAAALGKVEESEELSLLCTAAVEELQHLLQGGEGREVVLPHSIIRMKYLDIIA